MARYVDHVKLFTDGGCKGNPGPGAIGFLIVDDNNNELKHHCECIGHTTNNRAEYKALICGLDQCAKYTRKRVTCYTDSQLLMNQMSGVWRLKNDALRELFFEVKRHEQAFEEVIYTSVKRTNPYMRKVDRSLNEAFEGR